MTVERTVGVKAMHIRKSVPGNPNGDKLLSVAGDWQEVVDFSESSEGRITFRLADGTTRVIPGTRLISVRRQMTN